MAPTTSGSKGTGQASLCIWKVVQSQRLVFPFRANSILSFPLVVCNAFFLRGRRPEKNERAAYLTLELVVVQSTQSLPSFSALING